MAVFRVQKTQNYTIMSNHHLRNKALSLKAKGLLSLMLSLPEDWDYTTRGLASICKEGVDSVCATVRELEAAGYIIRRRIRDKNGQMRGMEYTVLEQPQPPEQDKPSCAQPKQAKPKREKPVQANALLDQDVPVLMTNFPTILNRLTGMFSEDRSEFIASFDEYDLLIIDDLGVERSTEYAMEQMFFVIDSRYRSRRPMIITTNLKLSELKNPPDLAHARIYDRILERCAPILFDGKNFREENAGVTRQAAKDIVNSKHD